MPDATMIDPDALPSGTGCAACLERGGWWFHLRRCARCGEIGCCDSSPGQHASAHFRETGHTVMTSFEPGERWFWDFERQQVIDGPTMCEPLSHPVDQPVPGPAGSVPDDWEGRLH